MTVYFDAPDRFVVGALGAPGNRTFFVQARQDDRLASLILEKVQVGLLAERLADIVDGVRQLGEIEVPEPPEASHDHDPLNLPIQQRFRVGDIRIGWDRPGRRVVIELADEASDDALAVRLTLVQTLGFVARARHTVASGRPVCPLCAQPIDTAGHICPRANGYRAPLFN